MPEYKNEIADLKDAYTAGRLNLYLGAGVSMASGLPSWKELVVSMYFRYMAVEQWQRIKPFPNYLYAIGQWYLNKTNESLDIIIRKLKSNLEDDLFQHFLYECLYNPLDQQFVNNSFESNYNENRLLNAIALLINKKNHKVNSVITYNFDDLLERVLQIQGYTNYKSIFDEKSPLSNGHTPIYHPHGFVPFKKSGNETSIHGKVILSEDDYNSIANSNDYWANLLQISQLTSGTGLMIGLSLTDRNLRRLLDLIARIPINTNNYILLKRQPRLQLKDEDVSEIKKQADSIVQKMLNSGIKTQEKVFDHSRIILEELMQMDSEINDRVFNQMKVKPIWFDEYDQVAQFIEAIRN